MHQVYIYLSTAVLGSLPMMITHSIQCSMIGNFCMPCLDMLHLYSFLLIGSLQYSNIHNTWCFPEQTGYTMAPFISWTKHLRGKHQLLLQHSRSMIEGSTIPSTGMSQEQPLPGIGLYDPLHGRPACAESSSYHQGIGQIFPTKMQFSCRVLPRDGIKLAPSPPSIG